MLDCSCWSDPRSNANFDLNRPGYHIRGRFRGRITVKLNVV
jgi:hypothetical protein